MTVNEIRQSVQDLKAKYAGMSATSLRDNVLIGYSHHVLDKLTNAESVDALQDVLAENWALVNGTVVCYTALPAHDITHLLCDIAHFIADEKKLNPVEILLPGIALDSYRDGYGDITPDTDLKTLLQTHIVGTGGAYLLPVKLLTELDLTAASTQLGNPYFDAFKPVGNGYIDAEEYKRLVSHSSLTQTVFDAKQDYELLTSDTSTLLGQLKQLCGQLGINMVGNLGIEENAGAGAYPAIINFMEYYNQLDQAEIDNIPADLNREINTLLALVTDKTQNINATANMNTCIATRRSALIATMNGHEEALNRISLSRIKKESLIDEARTQFGTAKASLADALEKNTYTEGHDHFNLSTQLLTALHITFTIASLADLNIIKGLNSAEITAVCSNPELREQIVTQLRNLENLVVFALEMSPDKLAAFLQVNRDELVKAFIQSPRDLSALLISLDVEKCTLILDAWPNIIKSSDDFTRVMQYLNPEQRMAVIVALTGKWPELIKSSHEFYNVMRYLNPEQRTAVIVSFKDKWPGFIKTGDDFADVMEFLSPEQRTAVFVALTDKWSDFIKTGYDFAVVMQYLSQEQRTAVMVSFKDKWPDIIKSSHDLANVMQSLNPEQVMAVIVALTDKWPDIIKTGDDFADVMQYLSPEQRTAIFVAFTNKWPDLIQSGHDIALVMEPLNPEQRTVVFIAFADKWPDLIKSGHDFNQVMRNLSPDQRSIFFDAMKDALPRIIIESGDEFSWMIKPLSPEQRETLISIKQLMDNLVKTASDKDVKTFASALMSDDNARIRVQFEHLIEQSKTPAVLIAAISSLEPRWIEKINAAVGWKLTGAQLTSQSAIETRINQYIVQQIENKQTITGQYRQAIQSITDAQGERLRPTGNKLGKG